MRLLFNTLVLVKFLGRMLPIFGAKKRVFGIYTLLKRSNVLEGLYLHQRYILVMSYDFLPLLKFLGRAYIFLGQKTVF